MKVVTTSLLTAPAGTGKSYMVVYDLVTTFFPESAGVCWSNLPLGRVPDSHSTPPAFEGETFAYRIGQYCQEEHGMDAEAVTARIKLIPDDVLSAWRSGEYGPQDYFRDADLTGARIVVDECHNYCGVNSPKHVKTEWQQFCGELRHRGASIQFVTQSPLKLAKEVQAEAGLRQALVDAEQDRDPFLKITLAHWYELKAKLTGKYEACFVRIDLRDVDGKKTHRDHITRVKRDPAIFALYDSHAAPQAGGRAAGEAVHVREFERRNWPQLLWWFVKVNRFHFVRPAGYVVGALLLMLFWRPAFLFLQNRLARAAGATAAPTEPVDEVPESVSFDEFLSLQNQFDALVITADELNSKLSTAEQILRLNAAIVSLSPESCTLKDGRTYAIREKINGGDYDGRIIKEIDLRRRFVLLDSGERLYLSRPQDQAAAASTPGRSVPAQPTGPTLAPDFQTAFGTNNAFGGATAGFRSAPRSGLGDSVIGDSPRGFGGSFSNLRREPSASGGSHSQPGASSWHPVNENRQSPLPR